MGKCLHGIDESEQMEKKTELVNYRVCKLDVIYAFHQFFNVSKVQLLTIVR